MTNDVFKIINSDKYTERQKLWWTRIIATVAIVLGAILSSLVDDFDGWDPRELSHVSEAIQRQTLSVAVVEEVLAFGLA